MDIIWWCVENGWFKKMVRYVKVVVYILCVFGKEVL